MTSHLTVLIWNMSKKRNDPIKRNGKILRTFWPSISDQNYSKVCEFCTYPTSHSFFDFFSLIFQISIFQWLNCRNLKDELNRSYNGGGVVYLRKSEASRSSIQYVLSILLSWFLAQLLIDRWLNKTLCTSYFTLLILGTYVNWPVMKADPMC